MTKLELHKPVFDRLLRGEYSPPISCEVDISGECQNACIWCYFKDKLGDGLMRKETFANIIYSLQDVKAKSITFTGGGEPLTNHLFPYFVSKASGFKLGLITNGILLDRYIDTVKHFEFVRVSLDAATEGTYSKIKGTDNFHTVVSNIERCAKSVRTGISFVVCDENKHEIKMASDLASEVNAAYIQFKPENSNMKNLEILTGDKVTQRYFPDNFSPCKIAFSVGIITPNGDAYFCCQKRNMKDFVIGNINRDTFEQMWEARKTVKPGRCDPCRYVNYLKQNDSFSENGDFL